MNIRSAFFIKWMYYLLPVAILLFCISPLYANEANKLSGASYPKRTSTKKASYKTHVKAAASHGIAPIASNKQLKKYVAKNKLSNASCNKGCTIAKLTHSKPYLVPKANEVLNAIAKAFNAKTRSSFTVTSITRTLADQHRLRSVNVNATHGLSAHNFGSSYDISYIRFGGKKGSNARLERALENILADFQRRGKIYYIKEKWQSCFHVTVRG